MHYHEKSTDEELRRGCCEEHPLAQKYLYQRYFGKMLGIPMRYTGSRDEAVEVLNQAFLKIFQSIRQFREEGSFSGWMARIVFFTSIDFVRSRSAWTRVHDASTEYDQVVYNEILGKLAAEDIFKYVQQLPLATRTVFSLFALDGYPHDEIAGLLGIDESTSRWHVSQARKTLQNLLSKHYFTTSSMKA